MNNAGGAFSQFLTLIDASIICSSLSTISEGYITDNLVSARLSVGGGTEFIALQGCDKELTRPDLTYKQYINQEFKRI